MGFSAVSRTKNFRNTYVGEVLIDSGEITVKSCSTLSERLREWAGYVDSGKAGRGKRTLPYCGSLLLWLQTSGNPSSLGEKKAASTCGKEGRAWVCSKEALMASLLGLGKNRLLSDYPVSFLTFPWLVPSPYQISSWILTGFCLLPI